jgi:hypothetical protein
VKARVNQVYKKRGGKKKKKKKKKNRGDMLTKQKIRRKKTRQNQKRHALKRTGAESAVSTALGRPHDGVQCAFEKRGRCVRAVHWRRDMVRDHSRGGASADRRRGALVRRRVARIETRDVAKKPVVGTRCMGPPVGIGRARRLQEKRIHLAPQLGARSAPLPRDAPRPAHNLSRCC